MEIIDIFMTSWLRPEFTQRAIQNILDRTTPGTYRLHILDNQSSARTREPLVKLLEEGKIHSLLLHSLNTRCLWGKAVFNAMVEAKSKYYVVTDNDILVPKLEGGDWLSQMVGIMDRHPEIAFLTPQIPPTWLQDPYASNGDVVYCKAVGNHAKVVRRSAYPSYPQDMDKFGDDSLVCSLAAEKGYKTAFCSNIFCLTLDQADDWGYEKSELALDPRRAGYGKPYKYHVADTDTYRPPEELVFKVAGQAPSSAKAVYDKVCVMLPSRGRVRNGKLPKLIDSAYATASDPSKVLFSILVDEDDTETISYIMGRNQGDQIEMLINKDKSGPHLARFFNEIYDRTRYQEPGTLVSLVGDDMVFLTPGWESRILDKMNEHGGDAVVYCDDDNTQHENLCVHLFTSRKVVKATGKPFMCPWYPADYIDLVWMLVGKRSGILYYLSDVKIRHEHSAVKPAEERDPTFNRLRSVYEPERHPERLEAFVGEAIRNLSLNCIGDMGV